MTETRERNDIKETRFGGNVQRCQQHEHVPSARMYFPPPSNSSIRNGRTVQEKCCSKAYANSVRKRRTAVRERHATASPEDITLETKRRGSGTQRRRGLLSKKRTDNDKQASMLLLIVVTNRLKENCDNIYRENLNER